MVQARVGLIAESAIPLILPNDAVCHLRDAIYLTRLFEERDARIAHRRKLCWQLLEKSTRESIGAVKHGSKALLQHTYT